MDTKQRLKEPSSWAGIAALLIAGAQAAPDGLGQAIMYAAAALCGIAAYLLKEGKSV